MSPTQSDIRTKATQEKGFAVFADFRLIAKVFPTNALGTFNTDEAKPQKFSLHLDEIQLTTKLFSCFTFVIYSIHMYIQCIYIYVYMHICAYMYVMPM